MKKDLKDSHGESQVKKRKTKRFRDYVAKDFLYKRKGPWPQPSPEHPLGEAPAVMRINWKEHVDWWFHIGSRYLATIAFYSPIAYLKGFLNSSLDEISDKEFMELFQNSILSKFIKNDFDETDKKIFAKYMDGDDDYYILDFEIVKVVKPFPGMYISGTKTLLRKTDEGKYTYEPIVIHVDETDCYFHPGDGAGWELAKYYALQGAAHGITLVVHSILHFPLDSINAITKTAVPKDHILFRMLYPHLRFTLPLENAVLTSNMTVIKPTWWKTYAPHPGPAAGLRDLLVEGFKGIEGNASYNTYKYPMKPIKIHAFFGDFRDRYYEIFLKFVSKVLKDFDREDEVIIQWAKYVSHHVPGFPGADKIMEGDTLVRAVAYYMWSVTIGHGLDHETYDAIPVRKKPMRLRQKPPTYETKTCDRSKLNTFWDIGKYIMAQNMFFKAWTVTHLKDVKYDFEYDYQNEAVKEFFADLKALDKQLKDEGICYMDLDNIPASIQY
jgi:hypothetical protein